jgi:hypothetical protein
VGGKQGIFAVGLRDGFWPENPKKSPEKILFF